MKLPLRIEAVPAVGSFLKVSLERDIQDFLAYSNKFDNNYIVGFDNKIKAAHEVVSGKIYTKELAKTTSELKSTMSEVRPVLNKIEGYVKMSGKQLTTTVSGFGISAARYSLNRGNAEGLIQALGDLLHNIDVNRAVLSEQGLSKEIEVTLSDMREKINSLNTLQNQIISQRAIAVEENAAVFDDLCSTMKEILTAGQSLYKGVDKARMKDYTLSNLKKRVQYTPHKGDKEE
ncbi:MAG: hypothetical protein LBE13_04065 [Bacteroidales bacterium]|jgi:hypothetical protein|nr:hypothetical protein [Bacteroidales bacterium]